MRARTWPSRRLVAVTASLVVVGASLTMATAASAAPTGQLGAWGIGLQGQLGNGVSASSTPAVSVLSSGALAGKTVVQVTAGAGHACALTSDGLVACWGANNQGQLGVGAAPVTSNVPLLVSGGTLAGKTVTQVSAGTLHTCAVLSDGTVSCWGDNSSGALGNGLSPTDSNVPVAVFAGAGSVLGGKQVTQVSAGAAATCAVAGGAVACWGANGFGGIGDGTTLARNVPVLVVTAAGTALNGKTVTQVSMGFGTACARTSDGGLACWGWNNKGQVGIATATVCGGDPCSTIPRLITDGVVPGSGALAGRSVAQVSVGTAATCATTTDGAAACWGWNQAGELGDGTTIDRAVPVLVATAAPSALAGKTVAQVTVGGAVVPLPGAACALATDGTVACWGNNTDGALGVATGVVCGATPCAKVPVSLNGPTGSGVLANTLATGVALGQNFGVALTATAPGAPTGVSAAPGDSKATVSWTAPASNGGSAITSYVVQQTVDAGTTWTAAAGSPTAGTATSLDVTGLTNGINVSFRVAAVNSAGQSAWSTPSVPVTPSPAAPTATVTITSPSNGSPISSGGYFNVHFTTTGVPDGTKAFLTLNGASKAELTTATGAFFTKIPAEEGSYAVRIGGGSGGPVLATSTPFQLTIIPFQLSGRSGTRFTVLPGNFSAGTTVYLTRNSATVASRRIPTKGAPFTITATPSAGTYQVWVASNQGRVYGAHAGVITIG